MDDRHLQKLFETEDIPAPSDNARKTALNMAVAEFEKNQKKSQGSSFLSRLIGRHQPKRRDTMSTFTKKKALYTALATTCAAVLLYTVTPVPEVFQASDDQAAVDTVAAPNKGEILEERDEALAPAPPVVIAQPADQAANKPTTEPVAQPIAPPVAPTVEGSRDRGQNLAEVKKDPKPMAPPAPQAEAEGYGGMVSMAAPMADMASPTASPAGSAAKRSVMMESHALTYAPPTAHPQEVGRDKFSDFEENPIKQVAADPISTFSIDVDTASYAFVRSSLDRGVLPQVDAVRVEEMVNYFDYAYFAPTDKTDPFKANVAIKPSPWHEGRKLVTIGIKGFDAQKTEAPDSNLVFLLDTSGSMNNPDKLPLLKQSLSMLLDSLKPTDTISVVVYAGSAGTVLEPTPVSEKGKILAALQNLQAGGSTAGAEGIRLAYNMAKANFDKDAVNRVILATDGDFNVGITNPEELQDFIERQRDSGIFLSVLGFGQGNYNDDMMQRLAQNGNGVAAYIDTLNEARKVLVEEASATLFPIAKDVKIQVEFNPAQVAEYRLVGYETRALKTEDFNNDKVDAGDIGAGAEVTAIYEITPVGGTLSVDESRYAPKAKPVDPNSDEYGYLKIRYKLPDEDKSKLITAPITSKRVSERHANVVEFHNDSIHMQKIDCSVMRSLECGQGQFLRETDWAVAVASFGQMLKGGKYTGEMTYDDILALANASKGDDPFGYRAEFITLIHKAKTAAAMQPQGGGYGGERR